MSKQIPPAPTASTAGPFPATYIIQISSTPRHWKLYPAPTHHLTTPKQQEHHERGNIPLFMTNLGRNTRLSETKLSLQDEIKELKRQIAIKDDRIAQIITSGYFKQLPPVPDSLHLGHGDYCFQTNSFDQALPHRIILTELFRSLQGQQDATVEFYLKKAKGTNGIKLSREVMEVKQQESLKAVFIKELEVENWEEAKRKSPVASKRVTELTDWKIKGDFIPKNLLDIIQVAKAGRNWEEETFEITIQVSLNNKSVNDIDFVEFIKDNYQRKMLNDLEKGRQACQ